MIRLASGILAALLLASLAVVSGVTPRDPWPAGPKLAAAAGGACGGASWFDTPGLSYSNGDYKATRGGDFWDASVGRWTYLKFDIQSWRLTGTGGGFISGHCYRRTRISEWSEDGQVGNLWMHARVWANQNGQCTQLVYDQWPPSQVANSSEWYTPWYDYSGCGGPNSDGYGFGSGFYWQGSAPNYPQSVPYGYAGLP